LEASRHNARAGTSELHHVRTLEFRTGIIGRDAWFAKVENLQAQVTVSLDNAVRLEDLLRHLITAARSRGPQAGAAGLPESRNAIRRRLAAVEKALADAESRGAAEDELARIAATAPRPPAQSRRMQADLDAGMDKRDAWIKEKSRRRAEKHRIREHRELTAGRLAREREADPAQQRLTRGGKELKHPWREDASERRPKFVPRRWVPKVPQAEGPGDKEEGEEEMEEGDEVRGPLRRKESLEKPSRTPGARRETRSRSWTWRKTKSEEASEEPGAPWRRAWVPSASSHEAHAPERLVSAQATLGKFKKPSKRAEQRRVWRPEGEYIATCVLCGVNSQSYQQCSDQVAPKASKGLPNPNSVLETCSTLYEISSDKIGTWIRIDLIVDSGASVSVLPAKLAEKLGISGEQDERSFESATGHRVESKGSAFVPISLIGGHTVNVKFMILDVQRPLLSVGRVLASGGEFHTAPDGSAMKIGGKWIDLYLRQGVYVIPAWIRTDTLHGKGVKPSPFGRQAPQP